MMFLGIGIIRTEKCWPNSPTYNTDVGVLRGWGRAQITVDILGREAKKVEKHWYRGIFCRACGMQSGLIICVTVSENALRPWSWVYTAQSQLLLEAD